MENCNKESNGVTIKALPELHPAKRHVGVALCAAADLPPFTAQTVSLILGKGGVD